MHVWSRMAYSLHTHIHIKINRIGVSQQKFTQFSNRYVQRNVTHTGHFLYVIKMLTIISFRFFLFHFCSPFSSYATFLSASARSLSLSHSYILDWIVFEMPKDVLLWNPISIRHLYFSFSRVLTLLLRCLCVFLPFDVHKDITSLKLWPHSASNFINNCATNTRAHSIVLRLNPIHRFPFCYDFVWLKSFLSWI